MQSIVLSLIVSYIVLILHHRIASIIGCLIICCKAFDLKRELMEYCIGIEHLNDDHNMRTDKYIKLEGIIKSSKKEINHLIFFIVLDRIIVVFSDIVLKGLATKEIQDEIQYHGLLKLTIRHLTDISVLAYTLYIIGKLNNSFKTDLINSLRKIIWSSKDRNEIDTWIRKKDYIEKNPPSMDVFGFPVDYKIWFGWIFFTSFQILQYFGTPFAFQKPIELVLNSIGINKLK